MRVASAVIKRCCDRYNNEGVSLLQATTHLSSGVSVLLEHCFASRRYEMFIVTSALDGAQRSAMYSVRSSYIRLRGAVTSFF